MSDQDPEEFCDHCFAGLLSSEHHSKCVVLAQHLAAEVTVIIPSRACWASHGGRAHLPHIFGTPPNVWRCTGTVHASLEHDREIFTPDATEWPGKQEEQ